jgi:hypothetical protein
MLRDRAMAPRVAAGAPTPPAAAAAEAIRAVAVTPVVAAMADTTKRTLSPLIWRNLSRTLRRPWHFRNRRNVKFPAIREAATAP